MEKRTEDAIKQEYADNCVKAGHLQYQILIQKEQLKEINEKLRELNLEAAELKKEENHE